GRVTTSTADTPRVTCNGRQAIVSKSVVRCAVPLTIGVNAVVLHATGADGSALSAGVRVVRRAPTGSVSIYPTTLALGTDQRGSVEAFTSAGLRAAHVGWSTSDSRVLSVTSFKSAAEIVPRTTGRSTVTARVDGRRAEAPVTVLEFAGPAAGTTVWS